jgi:hypothetical protein
MPGISRWSVRLSLSYLLLGFSLGALILANKGIPFAPWVWSTLPVHIDVLLFGFVFQFAIGIAYWILPRYPSGSRGSETIVIASVVLLNIGIWIASLAGGLRWPAGWLVIGRLSEGVAALLFLLQAWRRIRPTNVGQ